MVVHRISKSKYIDDLSGEGARLWGGRWNRPGMSVLYTSEHRSLALLELIVHFNSKRAFQNDFSFIKLEIPEGQIQTIKLEDLPKSFLEINNPALWGITETHFQENKVLALRVPSVLVHEESNILLNPKHEDFDSIKKLGIESVFLDDRFKALI